MSLPPVRWSSPGLPEVVGKLPGVGSALWSMALATSWGALNRGVREPFRADLRGSELIPIWYQTVDGWSCPLWRYPAEPGSTAEPVVLACGLGLNARTMDLNPDRSLVRALHRAGFDVWVLNHRGDSGSCAPTAHGGFDFDDLVAQDVPAALALVQETTGADRVLWIGHGLGGQLLYGHLGFEGLPEVAAGVTLCAPVLFQAPSSTARRVSQVASMLPREWNIPMGRLRDALVSGSTALRLGTLSRRIEGPLLRGLLLDGTEDIALGLIHQMALWTRTGHLCDRHNRLDYAAALQGRRFPLLAIAASDDPLCPPYAAEAAAKALHPSQVEWWQLEPGWSHLDPLAAADAPRTIFPRVIDWLDRWRKRCWTP